MATDTRSIGKFVGVGVGPGDPELLTLKALRLIQNAKVVSYIANESGVSQAKNIAIEAFKRAVDGQEHIAIRMPMSTNRDEANQSYDKGANEIQAALLAGNDVIFLCEGDPLFFGSFTYILERLKPNAVCEVVPGISSVHAASATLQQALTIQTESFSVVSGRHDDQTIENALCQHDTVVIMKAGKARARILKLLKKTNRFQDGHYLEYIGRENEKVVRDLAALTAEEGPYFSLFVVCRSSRHFEAYSWHFGI